MSKGLKVSFGRQCKVQELGHLLNTGLPQLNFTDHVRRLQNESKEARRGYYHMGESIMVFNPRAIVKTIRV